MKSLELKIKEIESQGKRENFIFSVVIFFLILFSIIGYLIFLK